MACLLVPVAEAVVTTVITQVVKKNERSREAADSLHGKTAEKTETLRFSQKLGWLNNLLWGGSALLAFEHVWHGEIAPAFPFLTAISSGETSAMLAEMATAGVGMSALITAVWLGMVGVSRAMEKRAAADTEADTAEV